MDQTQGETTRYNVGNYVLWHPKGAHVTIRGEATKEVVWTLPHRVCITEQHCTLVSVQHFDPDPIVVNVGKLKPYPVAEDIIPTDFPEPPLNKMEVKNIVFCNKDELPSP